MTPAREAIITQPGRRPCASADAAAVQRVEAVYPGAPVEIGAVRADMRSLLDGCWAADDAILCVCELATNAVRHSQSGAPGGCFVVRAEVHEGGYVWAEVEDQGGEWTRCAESGEDERGHGLDIVAALASDSGIDGDEAGRVAWFRIDWPGSGQEPGEGTCAADLAAK
jgi:serine/threonine-protein kinase RsbW